jgi:3'(2'), 5'-bisphosphate nucleotidase
MSSTFRYERYIAELAVQRAAILTKRVLSSVNKGELSKTDSTPVTIADFAAQALLISAIHKAFPTDQFVGEENADALRNNIPLQQRVWELVSTTHLDDEDSEAKLASPSSMEELFKIIDLGLGQGGRVGRIWVLDPVDGTATFLRGEQYAISLALVENGKQVVGVLGCPNLSLKTGRVNEQSVDKDGMGFMLSAVKGEGAVIRPMGMGCLQPAQRLEKSVQGPDDLKDLHFVDYTDTKTWWVEKVREVADLLGAVYPETEIWSSHMRYTALIVGGANVYVRIPVKRGTVSYIWDHAGAQLIFSEVGGKITDLEGKEMDFGCGRTLVNNWGMVAARETAHARILRIVADVLNKDIGKEVSS